MTAALALDGLAKRFGALVVTDDVTLDVAPGECHALIGPNGAGKSTLINQIAGVLKPDAGRVALEGRDVTGLGVAARARAGLGRTFQVASIAPGFTVLENAALAAQARAGTSFRFFRAAARERALNEAALSALARFGLDGRAEAVAATLSHGEKRLLELAMAVAGQPHILLLDEPMAGLGRGESEQVTNALSALKASVAMLLVEHDMDAVFALADRVSVLVSGEIVAAGTPQEVRADPAARAAYLGEATA